MLELKEVTKSFRGIRALDGVNFDLKPGEVHVLLGENGAGKSTLINIIAGMFAPTTGEVWIDGGQIDRFDPMHARRLGVGAVFQEFSLVLSLSVLDNLFLGRELTGAWGLDRKRMAAEARRVLEQLDFDLDLTVEVGELSRARRQMVEIAKALLLDARILILDEPTASLTDEEADHLLGIVRQLRERGVGIIYVSHRMREIRAISDRVTILRSGRYIGTAETKTTSDDQLIEMMIGRRIDALFPHIDHKPGKRALILSNVTSQTGGIANVSIDVCAGEVVGIAGLVGCGKESVGRTVFGLESLDGGTISVGGENVPAPEPLAMLRRNLCYFPSDRGSEGLAGALSIELNANIASFDLPRFNRFGFTSPLNERRAAGAAVERLNVKPPRLDNAVQNLSGGNRQKVMLARGLIRDVDVYIFDEPTVGIDVGAKAEIYKLISDLVARGAAVLLISSELIEVLKLSNRAYVMRGGQVVTELVGAQLTEEYALNAFFGHEGRKTPKEAANG